METKINDMPDAGPRGSGAQRRSPYWVATLWGGGFGALAFGLAVLLALPMRPKNPSGFEDLGWFIITAIFAAGAALLGGSVGTWRGLSRGGYRSPILTALLVLPSAIVLGAPTAGVGALAAPALAVWLAQGLVAPAAAGTATARGLWQRLIVTVVLCGGAVWLVVDRLHAGAVPLDTMALWATIAVVVGVGAPILLLRKVVPVPVVAAFVAVTLLAGTGGILYVRYVDAQSNLTIDDLARLAAKPGLPEGTQQAQSLVAQIPDALASDPPLPARVSVAVDMRDGSYESRVLPPQLSPGAGGYLPVDGRSQEPPVEASPASSRGRQIAADWERQLLDHGWRVETGLSYEPGSRPLWLPAPAAALVAASDVRTFSYGIWVRAVVLPHHDGAILVMAVRR
jgi:hypothetical protein